MHLSKRAKRRLMVMGGVAIALALGIFGTSRIRAVQKERLIARALEVGLEAYERGDLEVATEELSYYVARRKTEPEVVPVLIKFADARRRLPLPNAQHLVEATGYFQHARRLLAEHPGLLDHEVLQRQTRTQLLELFGQLGMSVELQDTAAQILAADPDDTDALAALVRALYQEREMEAALESLDRLITLLPDDPTWRYLKLKILWALERPEKELLVLCDEWIAEFPGDGRMNLLKAGWLADVGKVDAARATARVAADRGAESLEVLQRLVSLLDLLEMGDVASEALATALSRFPDEQWVREAVVRRLWQAGRVDEALAEVRRAEEHFLKLGSGLTRLQAVLLYSSERVEEARAVLDGMIAHEGEGGPADRAWANALRVRLEMPSWGEAIAAYRRALAVEANDPVLLSLLGEAHAMVGERSLAVENYERAFLLQPNWISVGAALADALLEAQRPHEAFRTARLLINRVAEPSVSLYLLLAESYLASIKAGGNPTLIDVETNRGIDVAVLLETLHGQDLNRPKVAALLVEAYCLTDRQESALEVIGRHLWSETPNAAVMLELAAVSRRCELTVAADLVAKAREIDGLTIPNALSEAALLAEQGRFEEGLVVIDRAIAAASRHEQDDPMTRTARVGFLLGMDHPDAATELTELCQQYPDSVEVQTFVLAQPSAWRDLELVRLAIERLERILGKDAPQARLARANHLLQFHGEDEGERARAMVLVAGVLEQSPNSLPALILMAKASLGGRTPSYDRAIKHLEHAVEVAPTRSELYVWLISLLQRQGDYETADRYMAKFGDLAAVDRTALRSELRLLFAQGDFETALLRASKLVDEMSATTDQLTLASLHRRAGEYAEAERIYMRLLAGPERSELVAAQAADYFASLGQFERAVGLLESAELGGGPEAVSLRLGLFHRRHGRLDTARQWLERAVEQVPGSAEPRYHLARVHLAIGDPDRARETAMHGLRLEPQHPGLRAMLASANLGLEGDERSSALALLRELGGEDEPLQATVTLLERIPVDDRGVTRPTDENLAAADQLIETHPRYLPAWLLAISVHREAGSQRKAIDIARRAVGRFPAQPQPAEWATRLLLETQRWEEALAEAQEWRRRTIQNPEPVDVVLASIHLELRRPSAAVEQLAPHESQLLADAERAPDRLGLWLRALVQAGHVDRAWAIVGDRIEDEPAWVHRWIDLSRSVDYRTARPMLARLESTTVAREPAVRLQLAQALSGLARRFEVDECFDDAMRLVPEQPGDPDLVTTRLFVLGHIAEGRGALEEAQRLYRQVVDRRPDHAVALNNLAFVLSQIPGRSDEAVAVAERVMAIAPDHPDVLDTYGHALLAAGRTSDARETITRARHLRPGEITIGLSWAEVLIADEAYEDAEEALRAARRHFDLLPVAEPALQRRLGDLEQQLRQARAAVRS